MVFSESIFTVPELPALDAGAFPKSENVMPPVTFKYPSGAL
jgi:hypothetical protein